MNSILTNVVGNEYHNNFTCTCIIMLVLLVTYFKIFSLLLIVTDTEAMYFIRLQARW